MTVVEHQKKPMNDVKHVMTTSSGHDWRESDVYKKAIEATGRDFRLKQSSFQERVDTWQPNVRKGFLHAVQSLAERQKDYKILFKVEVLDAASSMNETWIADTTSLYFQVAGQSPEVEKRVTEDSVLKRLDSMDDPIRKILLGAIIIHPIKDLKDSLLSDELLDEISILSKGKSKVEVALHVHSFMEQHVKKAQSDKRV